MTEVLGNANSVARKVFIVFLLLFCIGLIVYILPKEGKFRYEFQQGMPWMHDDLYATYDFAVYKLDDELQQEKDSIIREMRPYYLYLDTVSEQQIFKFEKDFERIWKRHLFEIDSLAEKQNRRTKRVLKQKFNDRTKRRYYIFLSNLIENIYRNGVIEYIDEQNRNSSIVVLQGKIAEERDFSELFTLKEAYQYIIKEIEKYSQTPEDKFSDQTEFMMSDRYFFNKFDLNRYIQPNLIFDEETTEKVKQNLLDELSLTRGMVKKGQEIISKGQIVTKDKYRKLMSLKNKYETRVGSASNFYFIVLGQFILVAAAVLVLFLFLYNFRKDILLSGLKTTFIFLTFVLTVLIAHIIIKIDVINLYIIPFTVLPIIIRTFYDTRTALFVHIVALLIIGFIAPNGFEFVFLQFIAGIIAIFTLSKLHRRGQLFTTTGAVFISYSLLHFGMAVIQEGDVSKLDWQNFAWFATNSLLLLAAYPLIYLFEKVFGFLSDVSLIELSNSNNTLLRQLAEKAPGTFQHSMQVANLSEEVIYEIGGNPLLVRVGALYHDIGKMVEPEYFTENQTAGINPHDKLEYDKSAEIIIGHVIKGVELARKHKLPQQIIDFIKTHHGLTKVLYFYRMFKNKYPDKNIDIEKFIYPGPTPFTKETAVLMMVDSVEAASKSLKVITEDTINDLVENIIDYQIKEQQHADADLTFKDISIIKKTLKKKLKNIYHARIQYPKDE